MLLSIWMNVPKFAQSAMSRLRTMAAIVKNASPTLSKKRLAPTKIEPLILAIDVGIKNMAYCYLRRMPNNEFGDFEFQNRSYEIKALDKISIGEWGQGIEKLVNKMADLLHGVMDEQGRPDVLVIEKQLAQSQTLRQLQYSIQSFVLGKYPFSPKIVYQSGKDKLKLCDQITLYNERSRLKSAYRANKIVGEKTVLSILENTEWHKKLCDTKKCDDLSDAFLHALYYAYKCR